MSDKADPMTDAPATEAEIAEADELRAALEDPTLAHEDAELARALAAAWSPRDLAQEKHQVIVDRALSRFDDARRKTRAIRASLGASAVLALAASVCVVLMGDRRPAAVSARAPGSGETRTEDITRVVSRSTQPLFAERFATVGGATSRIDRISMARASDLRENEFAKWGVR